MLKVKLKLTYGDAQLLARQMGEYVEMREFPREPLAKLFLDLWAQAFIKLEKNSVEPFPKSRSFSFTISQSIALMELLKKHRVEHGSYLDIMNREIIGTIDQQTA